MTKENKHSNTLAYKMLENRKYRVRRRLIENSIWISAHINKENPIWLKGYDVPLNDFHDFFEYITRVDKAEDPYTKCIFLLI